MSEEIDDLADADSSDPDSSNRLELISRVLDNPISGYLIRLALKIISADISARVFRACLGPDADPCDLERLLPSIPRDVGAKLLDSDLGVALEPNKRVRARVFEVLSERLQPLEEGCDPNLLRSLGKTEFMNGLARRLAFCDIREEQFPLVEDLGTSSPGRTVIHSVKRGSDCFEMSSRDMPGVDSTDYVHNVTVTHFRDFEGGRFEKRSKMLFDSSELYVGMRGLTELTCGDITRVNAFFDEILRLGVLATVYHDFDGRRIEWCGAYNSDEEQFFGFSVDHPDRKIICRGRAAGTDDDGIIDLSHVQYFVVPVGLEDHFADFLAIGQHELLLVNTDRGINRLREMIQAGADGGNIRELADDIETMINMLDVDFCGERVYQLQEAYTELVQSRQIS